MKYIWHLAFLISTDILRLMATRLKVNKIYYQYKLHNNKSLWWSCLCHSYPTVLECSPPLAGTKLLFVWDTVIKPCHESCSSLLLSSWGYMVVTAINSVIALMWLHFPSFYGRSDRVRTGKLFIFDGKQLNRIRWIDRQQVRNQDKPYPVNVEAPKEVLSPFSHSIIVKTA